MYAAYLIYCLVLAAIPVGVVLGYRSAAGVDVRSREAAWWFWTIACGVLASPAVLVAAATLIATITAWLHDSSSGGDTGVGLTAGLAYPLLYAGIVGVPSVIATACLLFLSPETLSNKSRVVLMGIGGTTAVLVVVGWVLVRIYCLPE